VGTLETTSRHTGTREKTQFVLLPYPTTVRYGINGRGFPSKAEENRELSNRVAEWLKNEAIHKLDSMVPTVLMGHLHIAGAGLSHTLYNITETDDVVFDTGPLIGPWQYIALGHIHKAQTIGGEKHIRYAGSLDRLHMDEREYETGVVRFDIGKNGLEGEPEVLPIEPTPMYQVEIVDPANELETLAERVPNCETALVHVTATYVPGGPSRDEIERKVRETFKRYTHLTWTRCESAANGTATRVTPTANYREAVRNYLATQLNNDPDSAELTKLAESFLTQEAAQ
jgi:exonuclease SbcD